MKLVFKNVEGNNIKIEEMHFDVSSPSEVDMVRQILGLDKHELFKPNFMKETLEMLESIIDDMKPREFTTFDDLFDKSLLAMKILHPGHHTAVKCKEKLFKETIEKEVADVFNFNTKAADFLEKCGYSNFELASTISESEFENIKQIPFMLNGFADEHKIEKDYIKSITISNTGIFIFEFLECDHDLCYCKEKKSLQRVPKDVVDKIIISGALVCRVGK